MILRIKKEGESEEVVEFWLEQDDDEIILMVKRQGYSSYSVCEITEKGLKRYVSIEDTGLPIDEKNRIKLNEEE